MPVLGLPPRNTRETKPQKLADYHWCQIAGKIPPNIKLGFWHATNIVQVIFKEINQGPLKQMDGIAVNGPDIR